MKCGDFIDVFGRKCFIYDCDAHTKDWYASKGFQQTPVSLQKNVPVYRYQAVPPHTGYGTEEDSMGSVMGL